MLQMHLGKESEGVNDSQTQEEDNSDYDADEHDGLLPRTYGDDGPQRRSKNSSSRAQRSQA